MPKTGEQKRKNDGIDASDRPAKMATNKKAIFGNSVAPSVGISGDAIPAPPTWGRVMEYLPYTGVLKCLLVNHMLSFEAPKYVKMLVILKSCEVEPLPLVKNRRRFENVNRVDILCLVVQDTEDPDSFSLCTDVIDKIVPFLRLFSNLKKCALGGIATDFGCYVFNYYSELCDSPEDHASHYSRLVKQLGAAFERVSLPQHLLLNGVFDDFDTIINGCGKVEDGECSFCSSILHAFPLNNLLQLHHEWHSCCYTDKEIEEWIRRRNWSPQCLASASARFASHEITGLVGVTVGKTYRKILEGKQAKDPFRLFYLPRFKADRLSLMLDIGVKLTMCEEIRTHMGNNAYFLCLLALTVATRKEVMR